jgi:serine phosphatase RsbU (regulator of sigma subunit)
MGRGRLAPPVAIETQGEQIVGPSTPSAAVGGDPIDVTVGTAAIDLHLRDVGRHGTRSGVVMAMALSALHTSRRSERKMANTMAEINEVLFDLTSPRGRSRSSRPSRRRTDER